MESESFAFELGGCLLAGGRWLTWPVHGRRAVGGAVRGLADLVAGGLARDMLTGEGRSRIAFGRVGAFDEVRRERPGRRCGQTTPQVRGDGASAPRVTIVAARLTADDDPLPAGRAARLSVALAGLAQILPPRVVRSRCSSERTRRSRRGLIAERQMVEVARHERAVVRPLGFAQEAAAEGDLVNAVRWLQGSRRSTEAYHRAGSGHSAGLIARTPRRVASRRAILRGLQTWAVGAEFRVTGEGGLRPGAACAGDLQCGSSRAGQYYGSGPTQAKTTRPTRAASATRSRSYSPTRHERARSATPDTTSSSGTSCTAGSSPNGTSCSSPSSRQRTQDDRIAERNSRSSATLQLRNREGAKVKMRPRDDRPEQASQDPGALDPGDHNDLTGLWMEPPALRGRARPHTARR